MIYSYDKVTGKLVKTKMGLKPYFCLYYCFEFIFIPPNGVRKGLQEYFDFYN